MSRFLPGDCEPPADARVRECGIILGMGLMGSICELIPAMFPDPFFVLCVASSKFFIESLIFIFLVRFNPHTARLQLFFYIYIEDHAGMAADHDRAPLIRTRTG